MQGYSRVILVGHSYGCYLVNRLASEAHAGEKVAGVVLIGAGYPVPGYECLRWIFYLPLFVSASASALLSVAQLCLATACIQGRSRAERMCEQWLICNMGSSALLGLCKYHKSGDFKRAILRGQWTAWLGVLQSLLCKGPSCLLGALQGSAFALS